MKEEFLALDVIKNDTTNRFELTVDGIIAFIDFKQKDQLIKLIHTEVPEALGGRGVAAALVEKTLVFLETNNFSLYPYCPYVYAYIKRHPDWKRVVDPTFPKYDEL
ncbi:GNAT family N-acetyltransferase [Faecalibacter sp. LW9]|uniref:GNAT family N-acetyltransferase n=1 Tax=Faecalibacter sp. LW9 TaxID=3103144 RepID=UPI002AFF9650|nr:GNAT family N-acetyltransferase [Faecalibacter sp. LW9]